MTARSADEATYGGVVHAGPFGQFPRRDAAARAGEPDAHADAVDPRVAQPRKLRAALALYHSRCARKILICNRQLNVDTRCSAGVKDRLTVGVELSHVSSS